MGLGYPGYYTIQALLFLYNLVIAYVFKLPYPSTPDCGIENINAVTELNKGGLFYVYLILFLLSFFIASLSYYFNRYFLPNEFANLGKIRSLLGIILRVSKTLLTFVHWILMLVICYFWYMISSFDQCLKKDEAIIWDTVRMDAAWITGTWFI